MYDSAAITSSGELYTWGCGEYGRLGHGDNVTQLRPKQVGYVMYDSAAITSSGELYTWGCGEYGRLGHEDNVTQLRPKQVGYV